MTDIPKTQSAVQLTGPDRLMLNTEKPLDPPGPYQVLCKVEAVGLCFSDLKLLKQFSKHARKGSIISGIDQNILDEIPSYVPDQKPTVPGHEAVIRVCAVGDKVKNIKVGTRCLVQTDYRWLPTENSNASFGYNFEGALQQYVIMDQRVITAPDGRSLLIPAPEDRSASAVALVEPWACVEDAYAVKERTTIKPSSRMLLVSDIDFDTKVFNDFLTAYGQPASITFVNNTSTALTNLPIQNVDTIESLPDVAFDDVICFSAIPETIESLFPKVAPAGLFNIVLCQNKIPRTVNATIGRVHYGGIRIIGTPTSDPADAMRHIPKTGEIRTGDKINVIGAAGPMGVMHVVRNICQGVKDIQVYTGDLDNDRLALLTKIAQPLAEKNNVAYLPYNPKEKSPDTDFNYTALMAPVGALVASSITSSVQNGIINIFAGIPAAVSAKINLDTYIRRHLYFIGTSGSILDDMLAVMQKLKNNSLNTDISVAAITGLDGAIDGIRAVENQLIPGKIIVYPHCKNLPLTCLSELTGPLSSVAKKLDAGLWNINAENELIKICSKK